MAGTIALEQVRARALQYEADAKLNAYHGNQHLANTLSAKGAGLLEAIKIIEDARDIATLEESADEVVTGGHEDNDNLEY